MIKKGGIMSSESDAEKKIVVDTDWKEQVRQEKAKQQAAEAQSAAQASPSEPQSEPQPEESSSQPEPRQAAAGHAPKPDFQVLISMLATQAFHALGHIPDPASGERLHQPEAAQFMIDLLAVLEDKTKGNLSAEENAMLEGVLHDLRMAYIALPKSP